jgi:hypothetical protein
MSLAPLIGDGRLVICVICRRFAANRIVEPVLRADARSYVLTPLRGYWGVH